MSPRLRRSLTVVAMLLWTATLVAAPPLASLSGAGATVSALAYAAGSLVCHQMPARSFHLAGAQLPVCSRCLGLYVGATLGAFAWIVRSTRQRRAATTDYWPGHLRRTLLIAAAPTLVTVSTAWLGWWDPANEIRFALALPLGAAAGLLVAAFAAGDLE